MPDVLLITDPETTANPTCFSLASALKQAILAEAVEVQIQVLPVSDLVPAIMQGIEAGDRLICPLTLALPDWLDFPERTIYDYCRDVAAVQQRVSRWGYLSGSGSLWLPIVQTVKGPLYAEVIGLDDATQLELAPETCYRQPIHLSDAERQPLYALAHRLLQQFQAPPAVYLMQFGLANGFVFDRLLPFPAAPAIASLNVQTPDLFTCHWRCLTQQPILDVLIS